MAFNFIDCLAHSEASNYINHLNCAKNNPVLLQQERIGVIDFDAQGQAVAALNCMSQTNRVQEDYLVQQILPLLRNTANELRNVI